MPQSTTFKTLKNVVIQIDDDADTLQDVSGSTNKIDLSFENEVGTAKTFGTDYPAALVTGKMLSATVTAIYTTAQDEAWDLFYNWFIGGDDSPRTLQVDFPNSSPGSQRMSVECVLKKLPFSPDAESTDLLKVSVELTPSGAPTFSTIA